MKIIPYEPIHLLNIELQREQRHHVVTEQYASELSQYGGFTAIDGDKVIAIGGVIPLTPVRGYLWLFAADGYPQHWFAIHKAALRLIAEKMETHIRLESLSVFPASARWLEMLGMQCEGIMRRAGPDGADALMYSIVR